MILKNPKTEQIIEVQKITNGIVYKLFENHWMKESGIGETYSEPWSYDKNAYPDSSLTIQENIDNQAYNYLVTLFPEFEVTEDDLCWNNPQMRYRFYILNERVASGMVQKNGLRSILDRLSDMNAALSDDEKFIIEGRSMTIAYRPYINPIDIPVLEKELGVNIWMDENENIPTIDPDS